MIILIRHAQSEGNKNRTVHQMVPDHRVKLTEEGWQQAAEAGQRLRELLKPDDTLQIFTSPYRRTRETTEQIINSLTNRDRDEDPSPFNRSNITVYEEPRLREQDFGNFQPSSADMERMWKERADYGHFFYRIPMGESAADAYDRVSGFNESLWRQFENSEFPSVCVLVTHGLMTRIFLMKWYHWSVEYFEDLRNINHCEFIIMEKSRESGKYILQNTLRTWSELKRQRIAQEAQNEQNRAGSVSSPLSSSKEGSKEQTDPQRAGNERSDPRNSPLLAGNGPEKAKNEIEDHPTAGGESTEPTAPEERSEEKKSLLTKKLPVHLRHQQDAETPHEMSESEMEDYFDSSRGQKSAAGPLSSRERKPTIEDIRRWTAESGMGKGTKADALGDEPEVEDLEKAEEEDRSLRGAVY